MKILLVQDTDWVRRNPIQHNHLMERMVKRGHEVRIVDFEILWNESKEQSLTSKRKEIRISRLLPDAYHTVVRPSIIRLPLFDYISILINYPKELRRQFREFQPDVVIGDGLILPYLAFSLAKRYGIPTVYYCIDLDYKLMPYTLLQPIGKLFEQHNIRQADIVLSINEGLRDYTIQMGAKSEKTKVIRAGIDPAQFNPYIKGEHIRKKYGLKPTDFVMFFVGWLYHFSGLKEVAKELKNCSDENVKLFIVGDGDAYADLQHIIQNENLSNQVILAGKQEYTNVPEFMATADIFLLPAYPNEPIMQDIVPIKMYEYLAMGKPVVATRFPGIEKEFGQSSGVIYMDGPDSTLPSIQVAIKKDELKKKSEEAINFVNSLNWETIADQFETTLLGI